MWRISNKSDMVSVEAWIYINLDSRGDRRAAVEAQLREAGVSPDRVHRIAAVQHEKGYIGCSMSHVLALELMLQKGWARAAIVEDDFAWGINVEDALPVLERALAAPCDVFLLSMSSYRRVTQPREDGLVRVVQSRYTSGYVATLEYAPKLLQSFRDRVEEQAACDMVWQSLQKRDVWLGTVPPLGYQTPSYSDIEKRFVSRPHK